MELIFINSYAQYLKAKGENGFKGLTLNYKSVFLAQELVITTIKLLSQIFFPKITKNFYKVAKRFFLKYYRLAYLNWYLNLDCYTTNISAILPTIFLQVSVIFG